MKITCNLDDDLWQAVLAGHEAKLREGGFSLGDSKPAAIITCERYHELWQAILGKCSELEKLPGARPDMRSAGLVDHDGRGMSAIQKVGHDDGSRSVYRVQARENPRGGISVSHDGPWLDSHDQFWTEQLADRTGAVIIGNTHYRIMPDLPTSSRDHAGMAGRLYRIRMLATGEVIETRNLWHQGVIPPSWRDRLPDDAEFVTASDSAPEVQA